MWANAHETRDSITVILYAGCLGLSSPVTWAKIYSFKCASQPEIAKKSLKPLFWGFKVVQGHRCWYYRKARWQCLLWCAASLCLSATVLLLDWTTVAEIARFEGGTQIWCTGMEDSLNLARGSKIALLQSTFNAENFRCGLSWSITNGFSTVHCWNVCCSLKLQKITKSPYFEGSRSFRVIDFGTTGKLVSSACYDTQQVCVYLQPLSR